MAKRKNWKMAGLLDNSDSKCHVNTKTSESSWLWFLRAFISPRSNHCVQKQTSHIYCCCEMSVVWGQSHLIRLLQSNRCSFVPFSLGNQWRISSDWRRQSKIKKYRWELILLWYIKCLENYVCFLKIIVCIIQYPITTQTRKFCQKYWWVGIEWVLRTTDMCVPLCPSAPNSCITLSTLLSHIVLKNRLSPFKPSLMVMSFGYWRRTLQISLHHMSVWLTLNRHWGQRWSAAYKCCYSASVSFSV